MDARTRSRGLARVNRLTGWLAGGAVVVSGAFVALLAHPQARSGAASRPSTNPTTPGVTAPPVTASGVTDDPSATSGPTTTLDPFAGSAVDGGVASPALNPPVHVPRSSSQPSQVSSGGS